MKYFSLIFLFFLGFQSDAQNGLVAHFTFDQCGEVVDVTGINTSTFPDFDLGFPSGIIGCACGVRDSALVMEGSQDVGGTTFEDKIFLNGNYDNYFDDDDFTISMFFKVTDYNGNRTLISKMEDCNDDNGISIRYTGATNFITAYVGEDAIKNVNIAGKLNNDRCWHHIVLIKKGNRVSFYADGLLIGEKPTVGIMNPKNSNLLTLGYGPCVGSVDFAFAGYIDDLRVYNRAVPRSEVEDFSYDIDLIGNRRDTLIIEGTSVDIFISPTCADDFSWSPADPSFGVDDPTDPNTRITPPEDGTFVLSMIDPDTIGGCVATDTINIRVVDADSLDCDQILLPEAFTPNGDGTNDNYFISNPYAIADFVSFEIFDRWGGRVFYSENVFAQWKGDFNGKRINPGVCVYRIVYNCQGEEKIKLGSLTVLR
jgi:gliding motility-associated-like protein